MPALILGTGAMPMNALMEAADQDCPSAQLQLASRIHHDNVPDFNEACYW